MEPRHHWVRWVGSVVVAAIAVAPGAAQGPAPAAPAVPDAFTIDQAMQYAIDHYPTVRAAIESVNASNAGVDVARAAYLPRLDAVWQSNRATANNVFGQLLPQSIIPAMSGPVLPSASAASVWGSATGALFSWEPFDFGLRRAEVASASVVVTRARAGEALTRLEVEGAVAEAFLGVAAAQRAVAAAQADVARREVLRRTVQTLVDTQLRPGADASRADAERAAALTRLIQAQQIAAVAGSTLQRVLGITSGQVAIAADSLIARVPTSDATASSVAAHPFVQVHQASVDEARAAEGVLAHTDRPRVYVQSSVFARGSGASANGTVDGGADGLGLDRANWAAGVQVVVPNLFDYGTLRSRKAAASASTREQAALYDDALLSITGEQQAAAAWLHAARAIAANTPVQLAAARQSETQARARYDAGLTGIVDVADAQTLLAQAEVQDQLARVDVWRALLAVAEANGDLSAFVGAVRQP